MSKTMNFWRRPSRFHYLPAVLSAATQRTFATLPTGLRIYAVGDIHGRADCLSNVFARIDADMLRFPVQETLEVYLGDYIDRGFDSRRVIELMISRRKIRRCVNLLGNHEAMLIAARENTQAGDIWRQSGAPSTLAAYGVNITKSREVSKAWQTDLHYFFSLFPLDHINFLLSCRTSYACGSYFFCHAGVRPGVNLENQASIDLLWIRHPFLSSEVDHGAIIVHGHTPVNTPDIRRNRINIDTGAYLTGYLSCMALEGNDSIAI